MSILHRFFKKDTAAHDTAGTNQFCIVDASGFIDKRFREANGQPSPRDNFNILKSLAFFSQREEIKISAVFIGRPLREAGEGDTFKNVTVYYAEDENSLARKTMQLARSGSSRKEIIVVTDNRHIEQDAAKQGAQCMRLATLKKGMEGGFDHDRQPQQRQMHRRPPSESEMREPREPREQREPQQQAQQPAAEQAPEENEKANKNVLDLIDPI